MNKHYLIERDYQIGEVLFLEYEKLEGYHVKPKINQKNAIQVSQVILVQPSLCSKIVQKKVELQMRHLMHLMHELDTTEDSGEAGVRKCLMDAEKLKLKIIQEYVKYLGNSYASLSVKKLQLMMDSLRTQLVQYSKKKNDYPVMSFDREEVPVKAGRKGR